MGILDRLSGGSGGAGVQRVFGDLSYRPGRTQKTGRTGPGQWSISIQVEPVWALTDQRALAMPVAQAAAEQLKTLMLRGGLGASPASTMQRKTRRDRQWTARKTSGHWGSRGPRKYRRSKAMKYIRRRFSATKMGNFSPTTYANGWRGVESGMLASSLVAGRSPDGKGISIYVAGRRGLSSPTSGSAVQRVFSTGAGRGLMRRALTSTAVRAAAQDAAENMIAKSAYALMLQVRQTATMLNSAMAKDWSIDGD